MSGETEAWPLSERMCVCNKRLGQRAGWRKPTLDQQHLESHRNPGGATNMIGQGDGAVVMSVLFVE